MVRLLGADETLLEKVVSLGDQNAKHLGHFPASCYKREAEANRILVAVSAADELLGYLLFRVSRNRCVVQHCCVAAASRRIGVGCRLVDELKRRTTHLDGIVAHCATDFTIAQQFWSSQDFVPIAEKPGRGRVARALTRFFYDHRPGTIFDREDDNRIMVAIDTNIVLDWFDEGRPNREESMPLRAEWLDAMVDLRIADETYRDIARDTDDEQRRRRRSQLVGIAKIDEDRARAKIVLDELKTAIAWGSRSQAAMSDLGHLAAAVAGGAVALITQDQQLLNTNEHMQRVYNFSVLTPAELITRFDQLAREEAYAPGRLDNSEVAYRRPVEHEMRAIASVFIDSGAGEKGSLLRKRIGSLAADTQSDLHVIEYPRGAMAGIVGRRPVMTESVLGVELMRFKRGGIANTLLRHMCVRLIREAEQLALSLIDIRDPYISTEVAEALHEAGFVRDESWKRPVASGWRDEASMPDAARELLQSARASGMCPIEQFAMLERRFWPMKCKDANIPSYIVPIQPQWASQLFDDKLAGEILFAADPDLMLRIENVYYRSSHIPVVRRPGRILWYVSKNKDFSGVGAIRAASSVHDVEIAPAKALFARYRRLGVYSWDDVLDVVGGDPHTKLMAIVFGPTELFSHTVSRGTIVAALARQDREEPPLSMPVQIPESVFRELYDIGLGRR